MEPVEPVRGLNFRNDDSVEITIATNAGACFGVVRAIKLGRQAIQRTKSRPEKLYSLGPLIHNPHVVKDFESHGVKTVNEADEVSSGTVLLRSHGVKKEIEREIRSRGIQIVDATCPLVKKPQRIAQSAAEKGCFLVVVGDANHPEVKGVVSYFGKPDFLVTYDPKTINTIPTTVNRIAVIAQTTIEAHVFHSVVTAIRARCSDVFVYNTICDATSIRQSEAERLARLADVLVVVGGKNSSNTTKLVKICKDFQSATYHIEDLKELDPSWFVDKKKIAVTGGASTPHDYVDQAGEEIAHLIRREVH